MISFQIRQRKSLIYYMALLILSLFVFSSQIYLEQFIGALTIIWGVYIILRFSHLYDNNDQPFPKILSLPSRILFGYHQLTRKNANSIIDNFMRQDFLICLFLSILFLIWGLYCSVNPAKISLIETFWQDKKQFLSSPIELKIYTYHIINNLSYFLMIILVAIASISHAQNKNVFKLFILPLILAISLWIIIFSPLLSLHDYSEFSYLKGIGWGQLEVFQLLAPNSFEEVNSGFTHRYIETGLIGAYGFYIIFLPLIFHYVTQLLRGNHKLDNALALIIVILAFFIDFIFQWNAWMPALQLLTLAYLASVWAVKQPS